MPSPICKTPEMTLYAFMMMSFERDVTKRSGEPERPPSGEGRQRRLVPEAEGEGAHPFDAVAVLLLVELELGALGDRGDLQLLLDLLDERLHRAVRAHGVELVGRRQPGVHHRGDAEL